MWASSKDIDEGSPGICSRNLGPTESGIDQSHLNHVDSQIVSHGRAGDGDVGLVHVVDPDA